MKHIAQGVLALAFTFAFAGSAFAERINCSNKYRSGKLSFSQRLYDDALDQFKTAVDVCPEEGEYHMYYAMAICEIASRKFQEAYTLASTQEEQDQLLAEAFEMFEFAGVQFDSAMVVKPKKKIRKQIRENKEHYWVDHYNLGVKMMKEEKFSIASNEFRIARLLDPEDTRGYLQGASAYIYLEQKAEAAELVLQGLEVEPENKELTELRDNLFMDTAQTLIGQAGEAQDPVLAEESAEKALGYLAQLEELTPDDANVYFETGSAYMLKGRALKNQDKDGAADLRLSADTFAKAAELVPAEGENFEFHKFAMLNRLLAIYEIGDCCETLKAAVDYIKIDHTDEVPFQIIASCEAQMDNTDGAVSALMVYKALNGEEVSVQDAVNNATGDAKTELDSQGPPTQVWTYQESESGNQINVWFWIESKQAMAFILGNKQGSLQWNTASCD